MDPERQQQIMGYFIEEAKEHLDTLETGLLDLQSIVSDQERVNELFRAAHSVKGGAAMLGFGSIQKTAHRLEDSFKVLKEQPVTVDEKLETLFLKGFDTLKDLLEKLQGPYGIRDEDADRLVSESEPVFKELQDYLDSLTGGGGGGETGAKGEAQPSKDLPRETIATLQQMLKLFKQQADAENRKRLGVLCNHLAEMGSEMENWQNLVNTASKAIANPKNSYETLAPVVIKELKYASDFVAVGKPDTTPPSPVLLELAGMPATEAGVNLGANEFILESDPKAAAKKLIEMFDKKQLTQLTKILVKEVKSGK
ncbi:Hpt domain-containing protein [Phormidium sp. CCY1219]|uniref:Hpt domain-containing protein n=1 Tax=Phormidium sp. CCY1219 TaxID=2886104 RepID=UPI002D1F4F83|nr:Hpt domain-containing protein [Phormidium sp. CCY1219]MEB3831249.1 Hpt domain-containing protein [Phormidium sp. CCY1219]